MRLFRILSLVCAVSVFGTATLSPSAEEPAKQWHTSFVSAQAEAKRLNLPILLHFYADWCMPCRRMEREVLKDPQLLKQMGNRMVAVKINADQHQDLVERYSVRALPADVFVDPDGRLLGRIDSHEGKASYLAQIAKVEARFASVAKVQVATSKSPRTLPEASQATTDGQPSIGQNDTLSSEPPAAAVKTDPSLIGLKSYSPVALAKHRKWRKGKAQFAATHKGIVYHLADADEHAEFQADPQRYSPRLLGCDPVLLWETDRAIAGSIRYGAYYDGKLYFFSTRENREQFRETPTRYTQSRHVLRADRIERTVLR